MVIILYCAEPWTDWLKTNNRSEHSEARSAQRRARRENKMENVTA